MGWWNVKCKARGPLVSPQELCRRAIMTNTMSKAVEVVPHSACSELWSDWSLRILFFTEVRGCYQGAYILLFYPVLQNHKPFRFGFGERSVSLFVNGHRPLTEFLERSWESAKDNHMNKMQLVAHYEPYYSLINIIKTSNRPWHSSRAPCLFSTRSLLFGPSRFSTWKE